MKKSVLIRGVDESVYRAAKAAASLKGVTLGEAFNEALVDWIRRAETGFSEPEVAMNLEFIKSNWDVLHKSRGKVVVVAQGKLQGVFDGFERARSTASRFRVAYTFVVEEKPEARVVELGPEMEV